MFCFLGTECISHLVKCVCLCVCGRFFAFVLVLCLVQFFFLFATISALFQFSVFREISLSRAENHVHERMCMPEHMFVITINVLLSVEHNGLSSLRYFYAPNGKWFMKKSSSTCASTIHTAQPTPFSNKIWNERVEKKAFFKRQSNAVFVCEKSKRSESHYIHLIPMAMSSYTRLIKFGLNELILLRAITSLKS